MHFSLHFPDDDGGGQGDETIRGEETRAVTHVPSLRLPEPADGASSLPAPHVYYEQQAKDLWPAVSRAPEPPADGQMGPPAALFQKTVMEHLPLVTVLRQRLSARSLTTAGTCDRAQPARDRRRIDRLGNRRTTGDRKFATAEPERWDELFTKARWRFYDAKELITCATAPAQPLARRQARLHEAREHLVRAQLCLQRLPTRMRERPRWQHLHENIAERLCWVQKLLAQDEAVGLPAPELPRRAALRQGLMVVLVLCALDLLRYLEQVQVGTDGHSPHIQRIAAARHALATLTRMRGGSHAWHLAAWQAYIMCQHALAGAPPGEDDPGWPKVQVGLGQAMQTLLILQRVLD